MATIKNTNSVSLVISKSYFMLFVSIASLIIVFQKLHWDLPLYINNYANDFLCMPIVLFITQYVVRKLKGNPILNFSPVLIIIATLFYSVFFEWYLPKINPRYTADLIDVIMYVFGAFFFFIAENKMPK